MENRDIIIVSKDAIEKIKSGFLWIFSNQILNRNAINKKISLVDVCDLSKSFIATGVYNPHSLIAVRILSYKRDIVYDKKFFTEKILQSIERRVNLGFDIRYCRICYGESDFLPGLIIDRYDKVIAIQFYSAGLELFIEEIVESLIDLFNPTNIVLRNDFYLRKYENVEEYTKIVYSTKKLDKYVIINHLNNKFYVDVINGQKTGFYYDQKNNRQYLSNIVKDKSVLDLCCYTGSFSIISKYFGAKNVLGVDSSSEAIKTAVENAKENNLDIKFFNTDVEEFLKIENKKYDVILFDPPSYCKSKKDKSKSIKKYIKMCNNILKLLNSNGILHFSVCSHHIDWQDVKDILFQSLVNEQKKGYILNYGIQSLDHPIYNIMKETEYLKCITILVK